MQGRQERVLIPGAIGLLSALITLWSAAGLNNSPLQRFAFLQGVEGKELPVILGLLVAVGVTNFGIGYFCQIVFITWAFRPRARFSDFGRLVSAFEIQDVVASSDPELVYERLHEPLLAEFHLRLHSHAPQSLLDYCSRRNSAWYIAGTSGVALVMGWVFAVAVMWSGSRSLTDLWSCLPVPVRVVLVLEFGLIFGACAALLVQAGRWNREFWEVCWKWITWDLRMHPVSPDWHQQLAAELRPSSRSSWRNTSALADFVGSLLRHFRRTVRS